MQPILSLVGKPNGTDCLHIDLMAFEAPMKSALHRAAVFLGYAYHTSQVPPLETIGLNAAIELNVGVPDPIELPEREKYQAEFTAWSIGQALVELDQSYQRYASSALDTISRAQHYLQNQVLPENSKPNLANTWKIHTQFYTDVDQRGPKYEEEAGCLRSLGNARNCLVHDSGVVTRRRLTDGDTMPVRWIGRDMFKTSIRGERITLPRDRPYRARLEDVGQQLSVEEVWREERFKLGQRVVFSQTDLSEIIFFYQHLAMQLGGAMHKWVAAVRLGTS